MTSSNAETQAISPLLVEHVPLSGVHVVEASAGTGKTFTITSLIVRFVVERQRGIESLLAVTFTNAATAELKDRVAARLAQALAAVRDRTPPQDDPVLKGICALPNQGRVELLLTRALADVDRAGIFTIHGFAARILKGHELQTKTSSDAELVGDQRAVIVDVVTDFWSTHVATLPPDTFRLVGGEGLYRLLLRVAGTASGAFEVPLVEARNVVDLQSAICDMNATFQKARVQFQEQGRELLQILVESPSLNRNMMKVDSLRKDFEAYQRYFAGENPLSEHPETLRFTQSKVRASLKKGKPAVEHELLETCEGLWENWERVQLAVEHFKDHLRVQIAERVIEKSRLEHRHAGTQSFDGLLVDLCEALREGNTGAALAREIREEFPVALIDEFQDTDTLQYEIFRRIYERTANHSADALYFIGDPKQSIYAFRGADIFTYLEARKAADAVWALSTSYRASPKLVAAQNALFQNARQPLGLPNLGYEPVQPALGACDLLCDNQSRALPGMRLLFCADKKQDWLLITAQEVARFLSAHHQLDGRAVRPSDLAVLTRTNLEAQRVQAFLRSLGVPAVLHGDRSVFETPEARELRRLLRALYEPADQSLARTAFCTRIIGLGAAELSRMDVDAEYFEGWMARLRRWSTLLKVQGVAPAFVAILEEVDLTSLALRTVDGERLMTNLRHLLELLHEAQTVEHLGVAGLLRWLESAINDPTGHAMAEESRQLRLESDADAVTLTTVHRSKGLEYNIVFLPAVGRAEGGFFEEAYRYFEPSDGRSYLEVRGKETRAETASLHLRETRQEALRLGYVAFTRARHHVVALTGEVAAFSALGYWLHERELGVDDVLLSWDGLLKRLTVSQHQATVFALCERSQGSIVLSEVSEQKAFFSRENSSQQVLLEPARPRKLTESEKTSSFSSLTRGASVSRAAKEGRDVDEELDNGSEAASAAVDGAASISYLAEFPRGAGPGDALHAAFEHSPFSEGDAAQRAVVIERELVRRGFDSVQVQMAAECVERLLAFPLPSVSKDAPILLGTLPAERRVAEMEFSLPVGRSVTTGAAPHPNDRLSVDKLIGVLSRFGFSVGYLERLDTLGFAAWAGFLRGFIDLVYEWEGRLYALDYKSNYLGAHYSDYRMPGLHQAMEDHHYLLQALIYCVAVHRYGKQRIADYEYERHFGGMQYVFLRGIGPDPGAGVYWFRPQPELVVALDSLFDDPALSRPVDFGTIAGDTKFSAPGMDSGGQAR